MAITAHYTGGRLFTWRESLESVQRRVNSTLFFQSHKGYLISLHHIQEILWAEDSILIENGDILPLSRRRTKDMREAMSAANI